jgi:NAD(P)-dependent dehydrogenase (short-subunit alcohol dehydrogenase family)
MQLKNKVVVVTGGAGYLGSKFCSAIVEQGGTAIIADVDEAAAELLAAQIVAVWPGRAEAVSLDITCTTSINSLINGLEQRYGRIDALVNNAYPRNSEYGNRLEDVSYGSFCENVGMHLGGYFLAAQQFGIYFRKHGGGNIINMSSIYGAMTPRFDIYANTNMTMPVEYAAIKSAINQLTRYFAQYFKGDGIRVNSLSPGGILNGQPKPFIDKYKEHCSSKGMLDPQDVCGSLVYLLADSSRYVTGQNLLVDDGFAL